ncbi:MAG TPA: hypothetical protein VFX48_00300 [Saprospiraceae bacterium]|nr:hypothetical protein [Saprospiraceae bacterium]
MESGIHMMSGMDHVDSDQQSGVDFKVEANEIMQGTFVQYGFQIGI